MTDYPTTGTASVRISASPQDAFSLLTDLNRLPLLSPENQRCEFLEGSSQLEVGAKFRGHNKSGDYEWHADCEVTVLEPGAAFAYEVPIGFEHATTWSYSVKADGDGCIVSESFDAPMLALPDVYPGKLEGRCANLEMACQTTLSNLKTTLEAS